MFQQSRLDMLTAKVLDTRQRFLGVKPVKLFRVQVHGKRAILALSSRAWLSYFYGNRRQLTPLSCEMLTYATMFISEQCPEGFVAVSADELKILTLDYVGGVDQSIFNQQVLPLKYTPRKAIVHPVTRKLFILEADHHACSDQDLGTMHEKTTILIYLYIDLFIDPYIDRYIGRLHQESVHFEDHDIFLCATKNDSISTRVNMCLSLRVRVYPERGGSKGRTYPDKCHPPYIYIYGT